MSTPESSPDAKVIATDTTKSAPPVEPAKSPATSNYKPPPPANRAAAAFMQALFSPSSYKKWQIHNLDYDVYKWISILFGWCGADLLYLGSPLGAILKLFTNLVTFGYWWLVDALLAVNGRPQIQLFGTMMPAVGGTGIGAFRFRPSEPDAAPDQLQKHLNFMLYGLALLFGGWLGLDQLFAGSSFNCFMHILAFISFIGIPLALTAYAIRSYMFLFDTNRVIDQNWELFGAPKPKNKTAECPSIVSEIATTGLTATKAVAETSGLGILVKPFSMFVESFVAIAGMAVESTNVVINAFKTLGVFGTSALTLPPPSTEKIKGADTKGAAPTPAQQTTAPTTKGAAPEAATAATAEAPAVAKGAPIVPVVPEAPTTATKAKAQAASVVPVVAKASTAAPVAKAATAASVAKASTAPVVQPEGSIYSAYKAETERFGSQKGGALLEGAETPAWIPVTALLFSLTLGFIVVSSLVLYFRRSVQNGSKQTKAATATPLQQPDQDDDVPPEPRVPRIPESAEAERSSAA